MRPVANDLSAGIVLAVLLMSQCFGQTTTLTTVPTDAQGRCAIGTRYDAKGNCILHPTAEDRKAFGFIRDKHRQDFWAKEELRRRHLEQIDKDLKDDQLEHSKKQ